MNNREASWKEQSYYRSNEVKWKCFKLVFIFVRDIWILDVEVRGIKKFFALYLIIYIYYFFLLIVFL